MRCWLLLCSDLAIRSGTAMKLGPQNYDRDKGTLTFRTKYQSAQRVAVTRELRELLDTCEGHRPFVEILPRGPLRPRGYRRYTLSETSLRKAWRKLKRDCQITRDIRPHDLRRTTARSVYRQTKDLRVAQALLGHRDLPATLWYLQDDMVEVPITVLELAKLNPITERPQ